MSEEERHFASSPLHKPPYPFHHSGLGKWWQTCVCLSRDQTITLPLGGATQHGVRHGQPIRPWSTNAATPSLVRTDWSIWPKSDAFVPGSKRMSFANSWYWLRQIKGRSRSTTSSLKTPAPQHLFHVSLKAVVWRLLHHSSGDTEASRLWVVGLDRPSVRLPGHQDAWLGSAAPVCPYQVLGVATLRAACWLS